jgi:hypothetical protein
MRFGRPECSYARVGVANILSCSASSGWATTSMISTSNLCCFTISRICAICCCARRDVVVFPAMYNRSENSVTCCAHFLCRLSLQHGRDGLIHDVFGVAGGRDGISRNGTALLLKTFEISSQESQKHQFALVSAGGKVSQALPAHEPIVSRKCLSSLTTGLRRVKVPDDPVLAASPAPAVRAAARQPGCGPGNISCAQCLTWYSWGDSNHRPLDPQSWVGRAPSPHPVGLHETTPLL